MAADLTGVTWHKSSLSGSSGGNCVEVALVSASGHGSLRAVRDSKNPQGPKLLFTASGWSAFVEGVKLGEFDS
ncbi:DUF397 domain-containing protein [Streptosporangium carneum]|uniref:DUF397 domain-containing protein n=1 Tax=Streptosporangium carneum TaxID=47481 RepID=A0A9W6I1E9_9ACTN|nr:DUF397 domain-containing protein [Streptosporangium carneum]GLK10231.1 hypothetical protein GCM10017600_36370 [Streptosporangium carneum]